MLLQERPRGYRRRRFIAGGIVAVCAIVVWFAREPAMRFYHRHRQHQALERAQEYVLLGDLGNAMLSVRVAMQNFPDSADASRLTADILEIAGKNENSEAK